MARKHRGFAAGLLICTLGLAACGGSIGNPAEEGNTEAASELSSEAVPESEKAEEGQKERICLLFSSEDDDKNEPDGYYQGALAGCEALGYEMTALSGTDEREWESNLLRACEDGSDLIIAASPELADSIAEHCDAYPEISFVVMDTEVECSNVRSVYFDLEDGYYLAGAAAAMFARREMEGAETEALVIGWIGGMNLPIVQKYYCAFVQGARYVNPEIQILEDYVGSWSDPEREKELAFEQAERGADVILHVASEKEQGVLKASSSTLTTITCRRDQAMQRIIEAWAEGDWEEDEAICLSVKDGCVGLSDFQHSESVRQDPVLNEMEQHLDISAEESEPLDKEYKAY